MTCHEVQTELSLYLYGELDFAREEALEHHLVTCPFCERALAREKVWHTALNAEQQDVPLELLANCRRDLKGNIARSRSEVREPLSLWRRLLDLGITPSRWSLRLALASFLVFLGFGAGRWDSRDLAAPRDSTSLMGLFSPNTRVRDVQPGENGRVRIFVDRLNEEEVVARLDDKRVRQLLFAATRDLRDPAVRVDTVEALSGQGGIDVRDALLSSVRDDTNAAVRVKAVEGLKIFADDSATRETLKYVLQHDENASVRSQAIDILVPLTTRAEFSPELAATLAEIMHSEQADEYVQARCLQVLHDMKVPLNTY